MSGQPGSHVMNREAQMLEALRRAGKAGIKVTDLARQMDTAKGWTQQLLARLQGKGQAKRRWNGGRTCAIFYATEHAPATATASNEPRKTVQPPRRLNLDPAAPAIVPPGVKVTQCPGGQDTRFTFTPPHKRWRGQISRDWMDARLRNGSGHAG